MSRGVRRFLASLCASVMLAVAAASPAAAANQQQTGLVNVAIGDVTISDINVGLAAQIAAAVCDVNVGPVAVLANQVDATGVERTVCTTQGNDVVLSQN